MSPLAVSTVAAMCCHWPALRMPGGEVSVAIAHDQPQRVAGIDVEEEAVAAAGGDLVEDAAGSFRSRIEPRFQRQPATEIEFA